MEGSTPAITILLADDDPDDCLIIRDALEESQLAHTFIYMRDGMELMDYLRREGDYAVPERSPCQR